MARIVNVYDDAISWRSSAFHVAARYKEIGNGDGVHLDYVEVDVGGRLLPHARGEGTWFFCIEGTGSFLLEEEEIPCRAGDCLRAPRSAVRGIVNEGNVPLRLLAVRPSNEPWKVLSWLSRLHRG